MIRAQLLCPSCKGHTWEDKSTVSLHCLASLILKWHRFIAHKTFLSARGGWGVNAKYVQAQEKHDWAKTLLEVFSITCFQRQVQGTLCFKQPDFNWSSSGLFSLFNFINMPTFYTLEESSQLIVVVFSVKDIKFPIRLADTKNLNFTSCLWSTKTKHALHTAACFQEENGNKLLINVSGRHDNYETCLSKCLTISRNYFPYIFKIIDKMTSWLLVANKKVNNILKIFRIYLPNYIIKIKKNFSTHK